jgi:hypothetical protein
VGPSPHSIAPPRVVIEGCRWEDIKMDLEETGCSVLDWIIWLMTATSAELFWK